MPVELVRFANKVALVTGGGHGIGRATALRLAREGAAIIVADIDAEAASGVRQEMLDNGHAADVVTMDVTSDQSVADAFALVEARHGHLDVLVNTAGGAIPQPALTSTEPQRWMEEIDLNLLSVLRCVRSALPLLESAPGGASVVSVSSVNGLAAFGGYSYSAAKAGIDLVNRNLAVDYAQKGLRFNVVAPGTIDTRVWDGQPGSRERLGKIYPLGRIGTPDDIAAAIAFLASDDAAWITGITLPVEGGVLTGPAALLNWRPAEDV